MCEVAYNAWEGHLLHVADAMFATFSRWTSTGSVGPSSALQAWCVAANQSAECSRAVVDPEPWKIRYLPYNSWTRYLSNGVVPFPRFRKYRKVFLSRVCHDELVTHGVVCVTLRDNLGRTRSCSGSPEGTGSAADEPGRSVSPPRAYMAITLGATDGILSDGPVPGIPAPGAVTSREYERQYTSRCETRVSRRSCV